jgi:hypothetical protein
MLKAEITLRESIFTESHKSNNCKTHKGTSQLLAHSQRSSARGFGPTPKHPRSQQRGNFELRETQEARNN